MRKRSLRISADISLTMALFVAAYLALAFGDTLLLAKSRAEASEIPSPVVLNWIGTSERLSQFDWSD